LEECRKAIKASGDRAGQFAKWITAISAPKTTPFTFDLLWKSVPSLLFHHSDEAGTEMVGKSSVFFGNRPFL
jgi:hypothetical protein